MLILPHLSVFLEQMFNTYLNGLSQKFFKNDLLDLKVFWACQNQSVHLENLETLRITASMQANLVLLHGNIAEDENEAQRGIMLISAQSRSGLSTTPTVPPLHPARASQPGVRNRQEQLVQVPYRRPPAEHGVHIYYTGYHAEYLTESCRGK